MEKKVKKSAISGEYIIQQLESGTIEVYRIYDNVKGALREASESVGFSYDSGWTTRQFGNKLIKAYGSNNMANVGDYVVRELATGSIECYRTYDNTKGALREIADKIGFTYDPEWTTRQFGSKLIDKLD